MSSSSSFTIVLMVQPTSPSNSNPFKASSIASRVTQTLRERQYIVEPAPTGAMGGLTFDVTQIIQNLNDHRELIIALAMLGTELVKFLREYRQAHQESNESNVIIIVNGERLLLTQPDIDINKQLLEQLILESQPDAPLDEASVIIQYD